MDDETAEPAQRSASDRRKSVRDLIDLDPDNLAIAADMAKEDPALGSLTVMALLRRNPEVELPHARYALELLGLHSKSCLRDIDANAAHQLVQAAADARVEGDPTDHFPFWSEPVDERPAQ